MSLSRKSIFFIFLIAVIGAGTGLMLFSNAKRAASELQALQPVLDKQFREMVSAMKDRANKQADWLSKGELVENSKDALLIAEIAKTLQALPLQSSDDLARFDMLQTKISDYVARKLSAGKVSKELSREIEKSDMSAHKTRTAYFESVKHQRTLFATPLLKRITTPVAEAPTFPAEQLLLDKR
jgi:hypothetical protein